MSTTLDADDRLPDSLSEYPTVSLEWRFDDEETPSEVTVFPAAGGGDPMTHWLTVDRDHAVRLDDAR